MTQSLTELRKLIKKKNDGLPKGKKFNPFGKSRAQIEAFLGISSGGAAKSKAAKSTTGKKFQTSKISGAIASAIAKKTGGNTEGIHANLKKKVQDAINKKRRELKKQGKEATQKDLRAAAILAVRATVGDSMKGAKETKATHTETPKKTETNRTPKQAEPSLFDDFDDSPLKPEPQKSSSKLSGNGAYQQALSSLGIPRDGENPMKMMVRENEEISSGVKDLQVKGGQLPDAKPPKAWGTATEKDKEDFLSSVSNDHTAQMMLRSKSDIRWIQEAAEKHGMDFEEAFALNLYTKSNYAKINGILRGGDPNDFREGNETAKHTNDASIRTATVAASGLQKLPNFEGTVYRGFGLRDGMTLEDVERLYKAGSQVEEKAFTSSTNDKGIDNAFSRKDVQFIINSRTGRDVSQLSHSKSEQEILFQPSTQFTVLKTEKRDGKVYIYMDEK